VTPPERPVPPAWARRLVVALLPARDREFLTVDLEDAFCARRARGARALAWYLGQALHAAWTRRRPTRLDRGPAEGPGGAVVSSFVADLRSAWRGVRRGPGLSVAIVLSLGLGLGSASAMYSVVRAVVLAPLPYRQPDRLVTVWSKWVGFDRTWLSAKDVLDFKAESRSIEDLAMWSSDHVTLTGLGDASRLNAGTVTANTFAVLGATPLYGRGFTEAEAREADKSGHALYAVLGYDLWRATFSADPTMVGRSIRLDGQTVTVLGIMPARFQLPTDFTEDAADPTTLWIPLYNDPATANRGDHNYYGAARLRPGVSLGALNRELATLVAGFADGYPAAMHFSAFALSIDEDILGAVRPAMRVLLAGVLFLLLIACANAAALLVTRAETRRREWTTRVALGASRARLLRLQVLDGALFALAGGMLGITLALLAKRALVAIGPTAIPRAADVTVDWRVLAFMLAVSAGAAVLCSLAPAVHAMRLNVVAGLKDGTTNASSGRGRLRLRALLVVTQLSLGMLLLTGAGLMARTLGTMRAIDLGFTPAGVLTARIALPVDRYTRSDQVDHYLDTLTGQLRQMPGVQAAGVIRSLPLASTIGDRGLIVEGYTPPPGTNASGDWQVATPGAVEALGEHLLRGRLFRQSDTTATPLVALVNETLARTFWPGLDPIGRRVRFFGRQDRPWVTVVGLIGDVRHNGVTVAVKTKFYLPYAQFSAATGGGPITTGIVVVRTTGDPLALASPLRAVAASVDPEVPVAGTRPMTEVVDTALTAPRLTSQVLGSFAAVALLLSALGLFSLLVYLVTQRTQEIGIRMAIGASTGEIVRFVVVEGMRVTVVGLVVGLALSALAVQGVSSLLYGVTPWDPATWLGAPAVLLVVAALASVIPALRAAAIDPLRALRQV
jgi:putative ABC transport system permease protein